MEETPRDRRDQVSQFIRRRPLVIAACVLLAVAAIVLVIILRARPPGFISLSGTIEATEVVLSSKVVAKVKQVFVDEGDTVEQGDQLVILRGTEFREQVQQAEAALEAARAVLNEGLAGTRPEEIRQARAEVARTDAAVAGARRALDLAEEAYRENRELKTLLNAAETNYRASVAAYRRAQETLKLVRQGPREEQIQHARAQVQQAEATFTRAQQDARRATELFHRGAISATDLDAAVAAEATGRAQLQQARARLDELEAGSRPEEITEAEAAVEQAHALMVGARQGSEITRERYEERLQERQQLTEARTRDETARAQLKAAEARLQQLLAGPRAEEIARLRAQVNEARAALAQVRTLLTYTKVESPIDGTILTRAVEPGELASLGETLVTLADLSRVQLNVYVEQDIYGRIRLGQPAVVTVDSYPHESFRGRVTRIASKAEFTPKEIQTREERAKLVFKVQITLPNPEGKLKPGMPADAVLRLQPVTP